MGVEGGVLVSEDAGSLGLNGIMSGDESAQRATHGAHPQLPFTGALPSLGLNPYALPPLQGFEPS